MEKKKIEDLSNLVFGLALAIGAIALVEPANDDLVEMASILLRFALSFLVIIWIWLIYNTTMGRLQGEHRGFLAVNILLLFLVAVKPYLLTTVEKVARATLYALNLGTTLVILAVLNDYIVKEMAQVPGPELGQFRFRRNSLLSCAWSSTPRSPSVTCLTSQGSRPPRPRA